MTRCAAPTPSPADVKNDKGASAPPPTPMPNFSAQQQGVGLHPLHKAGPSCSAIRCSDQHSEGGQLGAFGPTGEHRR